MDEAFLTRRGVLGLALAGGFGVGTAANATASPGGEIVSWVSRTAVRLPRVDAEGAVDDLHALRGIAGGAWVVGLGEPSHGAHEQLTLRHRVARFLVEQMGFRTVAWEESWASGVAIDRYVVAGEGDPREIVGDAGFQWRSEAMLDLVRWMRAFNRHRRHDDKVRFLGSDVMEVRALPYDEVTRFVTDVAPERVEELRRDLDPIRFRGTIEAHFAWLFSHPVPERRRLVEHARAVRRLVASLPPGPSRIRHPDYLLDLNAKAPPQVRRWLDGPATMRLIGSAYDAARDADYMMRVESWRRGFDAILHLGTITPTRLLERKGL